MTSFSSAPLRLTSRHHQPPFRQDSSYLLPRPLLYLRDPHFIRRSRTTESYQPSPASQNTATAPTSYGRFPGSLGPAPAESTRGLGRTMECAVFRMVSSLLPDTHLSFTTFAKNQLTGSTSTPTPRNHNGRGPRSPPGPPLVMTPLPAHHPPISPADPPPAATPRPTPSAHTQPAAPPRTTR